MRNLRDLNLNSLRVVECAARTGSFVMAAEEQLITPSAVSQRVKNLEAQLRFKIFNRRNNSVVLTSEGNAFIAHVRDALDTILSAGLEAQSMNRDEILKISALPTFTVRWLLHRLTDFQDREPDIRLSLSNSYAPVNFAKEDFDLAIRYGNGEFQGLESQILFEEELTPVCSPSLLEEKYPRCSCDMEPEDLKDFTLLHSDTCTMNWRHWLELAGVPDVLGSARSAYFDSCMLSYEAASAGLGFAVANCSYMSKDVESGTLVSPFRSHFKSGFGWYVVYPIAHAHMQKVDAFERWIVEQASKSENVVERLFYGQRRTDDICAHR